MSDLTFTDRPLHLSTTSSLSTTPAWGRPRSPLAPHRLAKLANALGVSTPIPALHSCRSNSPTSTSSNTLFPEYPRRSPTPAASSTPNFGSYSQSTSKFFLHIIPPVHLPHDSDASENSGLTPPPATASGYHAQFRRGTLVPMHSTIQSQLGAIAKEYALPSTTGMVLYLVSSSSPRQNTFTPPASNAESESEPDAAEPGPRLSEEIWKHIWSRVAKAEREEGITASPRSASPSLFGLGMSIAGHSSPHLPRQASELGNNLPTGRTVPNRSQTHPQPLAYPFTPTPSSPSSISDLRSHTISAPSSSQSEPGTPDTSPSARSYAHKDSLQPDSLELPGLQFPSLIPILAKVEFDIDKKRAAWYDPWLRSRRMNHAKRAESRKRTLSESDGKQRAESVKEMEKKAPLDLELVGRLQSRGPAPGFTVSSEKTAVEVGENEHGNDYDQLSDSDSESGIEELDQEEGEEVTARVALRTEAKDIDPLVDVFGSDADTWEDLRSDSVVRERPSNPHVVELALNGTALDLLPDQDGADDGDFMKDEDEVEGIMDKMSRSGPPVPFPPTQSMAKRRMSLNSSPLKKRPPPPLVIPSSGEVSPDRSPLPLNIDKGTRLAYLRDANEPLSPDDLPGNTSLSPKDAERRRSAVEVKRDGMFEELDFRELEQLAKGQWDDSDPRKVQYKMKTQLDEMERRLAEFSPHELEGEKPRDDGATSHARTMSSPQTAVAMPTHHEEATQALRIRDRQTMPVPASPREAEWPTVPFASLSQKPSSPQQTSHSSSSQLTPQLTINGVTTAAPKYYEPNARVSEDALPSESDIRRNDLDDRDALYSTPLRPSIRRKDPSADSAMSPTIIPLSPDPFGRFSSSLRSTGNNRQASIYWENPPETVDYSASAAEGDGDVAEPSSSRFSADSMSGENSPVKGGLKKVNTLKKLWRKSAKSSISMANPPSSPPTIKSTPQPPAQTTQQPHPHQQSYQQHPPQPSYLQQPPQPSHQQPFHRPPYQTPQQQPHHLHLHSQHSPSLRPGVLPPGTSAQEQLAALIPPPPTSRSQSQHLVPPLKPRVKRTESVLDSLHFDQDSPYPVRRSSVGAKAAEFKQRQSTMAPPSPSPLTPTIPLSEALTKPRTPPPVPVMPVKEKEKNTSRKSILKSWKSNGSSSTSDKRTSVEQNRRDSGSGKLRRRSIVASSIQGSVSSMNIPVSPSIPEHWRGTAGSRPPLGTSPSDSSLPRASSSRPSMVNNYSDGPPSPTRSMMSRRSGDDTRPSYDSKQFRPG